MNEQTGNVIDAMFRGQMDAAYRFARLMRTGMGNGIKGTSDFIDRDGIIKTGGLGSDTKGG